MPLSLNEIRDRALAFSKEWKDEVSEEAEAKSFWDDFFNIFGISRRRTATFETKVNKLDNKEGYIDLLWKGVILIEHKSRGKDLKRAYNQAKDYFPGLKEKELPRYILVCDFERFHLYDLEDGWDRAFTLDRLADNIHLFDFLSGYKRHTYKEQDPVNIEAAELMGKLHDQLKAVGYAGHELEVYLVRLLFCLFADDTNIFEKGIFLELVESRTGEDGGDLAMYLDSLFVVLNTPSHARLRNLDEQLATFPYVNGRLFEERLPHAAFDSKMRQILIDCCYLDWSKISPAIFGSLFQSVMDEKARRNLGAHYTSEKNILKVIKPLFLDKLWEEFEKLKEDRKPVDKFHRGLSELRFLDPACGCGNFLIIAYRELRLLELEVLKVKFKNQIAINIEHYVNVNVDQFYGIEYEEFPAQIAQVAMWLIDHQMNQLVSEVFGEYFARLPLRKSAKIVHGNALRIDWQSMIERMPWDKEEPLFNYIFGNPPFIGSRLMTQEQRDDLVTVLENVEDGGLLDYVCGWFIKAAKHIKGSRIEVAFVSTNSIVQGEQTSILWQQMQKKFDVKINFAHRTFKWSNEAKGNAAVYCVIVGFANFTSTRKTIFDYRDVRGEPHEVKAKNINAYLVDASDILIVKSLKPICSVPSLIRGSIPYDDGNLLLSKEEADIIQRQDVEISNYIKLYGGANELINNKWRYCLWLKDAPPELLRHNSFIKERIGRVFEFRNNGKGQSVKSKANTPSVFGDIRQPTGDNYLLIPRHSSEKRKYIPIGFVDQSVILADSAYGLPNATLFYFGILTSEMHMV